MKNKEKIIGTDYTGWPIYKLTLREILKQLGAEVQDGWIGFDNNSSILDIFPVTLEDDGMGYGCEQMFITCADYQSERNHINIWREPLHPNLDDEIESLELDALEELEEDSNKYDYV